MSDRNSARAAFEAMLGKGDPIAATKRRMEVEEPAVEKPASASGNMSQADFGKARRMTPEEQAAKQKKLAALLRSR